MSDTSTLSELARFIGRSSLASENALVQRRAQAGIARGLRARSQRRGVGELLGAVLALSARTRRMIQPRVAVDLDVFAPGGTRSVRIVFGPRR